MKHLNILIFLGFSFFIVNTAAAQYDKIVIFGDSLSDTGNLASVRGTFPFPYYNNRVTDGPVAVDVLTALLNKDASASFHLIGQARGSNYAVAGASAAGNEPIDLQNQVRAFLLINGGHAAADNLYIIFIGGNDVRASRDVSKHKSKEVINSAVNAIEAQIRRLTNAGAKSFLVTNSPDIGAIPESLLLSQSSAGDDDDDKNPSRKATMNSIVYNQLLDKKLSRLKKELGIALVIFDLFGFADNFSSNPDSFDLVNIDTACFSSVTFTFHAGCEFGQRFKNYFYFDEIHPSSTLHERLGRGLFAVLPQNN